MGIKFDPNTNSWKASCCQRHPITGKPYSLRRLNLKSEAEAKRTEKELYSKIQQSFLEAKCPTWGTVVTAFVEDKKFTDWTDKTYYNAKVNLESYTFKYWKHKRVNTLTTKDVKSLLVNELSNKSQSTQQSLLKFIRGTFQYAIECGYISHNPSPTVRFRINNKIKMLLTEEQARLLIERAKSYDSDWYYHWAMALYTGMRNGELFALTWDKVNFENRSILVDTSWNRFDGFKSTKSGDDRIVEIAPTLLLTLKELKLKTYESGFVLPRSNNWEKGEQARILRMFLQGLGLPAIRFHDLRATWATIMLGKGIEPIKVMCMGGWKSLKTMQIYIRKAGVDIKGITNALDLHNPLAKKGADILDLKQL